MLDIQYIYDTYHISFKLDDSTPILADCPRKKENAVEKYQDYQVHLFSEILVYSKTIVQSRTGRREKCSSREPDERPTSRDARFGMESAAGKK